MNTRLKIVIILVFAGGFCINRTVVGWSISGFISKITGSPAPAPAPARPATHTAAPAPVSSPWSDAASATAKAIWVKAVKTQLGDYPHKNDVAYVRTGSSLPDSEIAAVAARKKAKVKPALSAMLGTKISSKQLPTIAFCCSGGGYRAMVATLGFVRGAEKIGLLDATTYMAGLSGSTWMMGPWLYRSKDRYVSLTDYTNILAPKLAKSPLKTSINKSDVLQTFSAKIVFEQPFSSVDLWGALIINALAGDLGHSGQKLFMTELSPQVGNGSVVFPIFTSAIVNNGNADEWMESTPYEVGSTFLGGFVPTWGFGRAFNNGKSIDFAREQTYGLIGFGVPGSAFTASPKEAKGDIQAILGNTGMEMVKALTPPKIKKWAEDHKAEEARFSPACFNNFTLNCPGLQKNTDPFLTCVDAGMAFNLPFPPLLRPERNVDIIIVCDASASVANAPALAKAEEYARAHDLKFPSIDYTDIDKRVVSIFKNNTDPTVPVVIYFPRVANPAYRNGFNPDPEKTAFCGTTNFVYTADQVNLLSGLMETAVVNSKNLIVNEIRERAQAKQQ